MMDVTLEINTLHCFFERMNFYLNDKKNIGCRDYAWTLVLSSEIRDVVRCGHGVYTRCALQVLKGVPQGRTENIILVQ